MRLRDETPGFGVSLIKAGLRLRGLDVGSVRPPLVDPTPTQEARLGAILDAGLALAERLDAAAVLVSGERRSTATIRSIAPAASACRCHGHGGPTSRPLARRGRRRGLGAATAGYGLLVDPAIGAEPPCARMLDHDISAFAVGRDADAEALWEPLWRHLHEAGGGGITTIAMAGLDLALWDLAARRAGLGITDHLGRRHDTAEVYGSGVNLHYPLDELVAQARPLGRGRLRRGEGQGRQARPRRRRAAHRRRARGDRTRPRGS